MKKILTYASILALSSGLMAQVSAVLVTKGPYGVHADKVAKALPDKTVVKHAATVMARSGRSWWHPDALAVSRLSHHRHWTGLSAHFQDSGSSRPAHRAGTTASATPVGAPHSAIWALKATKATKGKLVVTYFGKASANAGASAKVVFGTHSFVATATGKPVRKEFTGLTIGTTGLHIGITTAGKCGAASAGAIYHGSLSLYFIPETPSTKVTITVDKSSCKEGGALSGTVTTGTRHHAIKLLLKGTTPKSLGVKIVSGAGDVLKYNLAGCVVLAKPFWAGIYRTDTSGNAVSYLHMSKTKPMTFYTQMLTLDFTKGLNIWSSNTLKIVSQ